MTPRVKQLVLLGLAAALVLTAIARAWFTGHGVSVGLWGVELCDHGCRSTRWDNLPGAQDDLYLAGYAAFAASLVGALLTAAAAFGNVRAAKLARTVLTVAVAAMAYFVVRGVATDALDGVQVSWALFVGPAAAVGARQLVAR